MNCKVNNNKAFNRTGKKVWTGTLCRSMLISNIVFRQAHLLMEGVAHSNLDLSGK